VRSGLEIVAAVDQLKFTATITGCASVFIPGQLVVSEIGAGERTERLA